MGSDCLKVTKYFLFLFNLLFFILGAVILGFGLWILLDKISFISFLQTSSESLKVGAYILTGVGAITMLMGFLGCLGAVNEIRCLLGLYITFLMLILLAQVAAGLLIYFQRDTVKKEMSTMIHELIQDYDPGREDKKNIQDAWDYVQRKLFCCGWTSPENWTENVIIRNKSLTSYPCSCSNGTADSGFCDILANGTVSVADWPVHSKGCMNNVESWLQDNLGIILGVCTGVAVIELLGMVLAISLCKNIHREDYTKVPK
uniref:Tetraspanin n=1 Tax=Pelodiscus sinensis TaxID=13735 RepID=K7G1J0_PELSI|nr:CD82 antigen [Pelodiscus sinensis]|eukprot:XP_014429740.1 CD82 antigen [Pelodiscus sinensis]